MSLRLEPMGTLVVHIDQSWRLTNGPVSGRSCTTFREVVWDSPYLSARSLWANGTYQYGPEIAEPNIRVLFRTEDDVLLYLDYLVRIHHPTHNAERSPAIMSGRLEIDDANEKYRWLNRTQVMGYGRLDMTARTQTYEMSVLRWADDTGPRTQDP